MSYSYPTIIGDLASPGVEALDIAEAKVIAEDVNDVGTGQGRAGGAFGGVQGAAEHQPGCSFNDLGEELASIHGFSAKITGGLYL